MSSCDSCCLFGCKSDSLLLSGELCGLELGGKLGSLLFNSCLLGLKSGTLSLLLRIFKTVSLLSSSGSGCLLGGKSSDLLLGSALRVFKLRLESGSLLLGSGLLSLESS